MQEENFKKESDADLEAEEDKRKSSSAQAFNTLFKQMQESLNNLHTLVETTSRDQKEDLKKALVQQDSFFEKIEILEEKVTSVHVMTQQLEGIVMGEVPAMFKDLGLRLEVLEEKEIKFEAVQEEKILSIAQGVVNQQLKDDVLVKLQLEKLMKKQNEFETKLAAKAPDKVRGSSEKKEGSDSSDSEEDNFEFRNRRNSLMLGDCQIKKNKNVNIIVSEYLIPQGDIMVNLSPRGFRFVMRKYVLYKSTALDNSKKLVFFVSQEIVEKIVAYERKTKTILGRNLNFNNMFQLLTDNDVKVGIAKLLRPKNSSSYESLMLKSVSKFKSLKKNYNTYSLIGYSEALHTPFANLIEEFRDFDEFFRLGASVEELGQLPVHNWGTNNQPGVFRIFFKCLGAYEDAFRELAKESTIKGMFDLDTFITYVSNLNDDIGTQSMKAAKFELSHEENEEEKKNNFFEKKTGNDRFSNSKDDLRKNNFEGRNFDKKVFRMEVDEEKQESEDEFESESQKNEEETIENDIVEDTDDESEKEFDRQLKMMTNEGNKKVFDKNFSTGKKFQGGFSGGRVNTKTTSSKPVGDNPCFNMFLKGICANGKDCPYSHEPVVLEALAWKEYEKLINSPYGAKLKNAFPSISIREQQVPRK